MLDKASKSLEKLFFLISFAGFIEDSDGFKGRFSDWLKVRSLRRRPFALGPER